MHIFISQCSDCGVIEQVPEEVANEMLDERKNLGPSPDPLVARSLCGVLREVQPVPGRGLDENACGGQMQLLGVIEVLVPWEISKS